MPKRPDPALDPALPDDSPVMRFRVALLNVEPTIWRRIEVPSDYTFWDFHCAIQDAMGWTNSHLHLFTATDHCHQVMDRIGIPDEEGRTLSGVVLRINRYFNKVGDSANYRYDMGDDWRHYIAFEGMAERRPGVRYPTCTDGARACPIEDCGGPVIHDVWTRALANPKDAMHNEALGWFGEVGATELFDASEVHFSDPQLQWRHVLERQEMDRHRGGRRGRR